MGLEDNIWFDAKKTKKATNLALLKRIHSLMKENEKQLLNSLDLGLYNLGDERK